MNEDRKPRRDSKLDSMPESRVLELRDKLLANEGYEKILAWLAVECGVESSLSALSTFYKRHCAPVVRERRQISVLKAEALGDAMAADPVSWDEKIVERTKQLAFEFLSGDALDPDAVKALLDALTKANKQQLDRDKFQLLKAKAERADEAAGVANNEKLSAEQKAAEIKRIFRMG